MARCTRTLDPVSSSGLRRRRWRKTMGAISRRCARLTFFAPRKAAMARVVRSSVSSARKPSVPSFWHSAAHWCSMSSLTSRRPSALRALRMFLRSSWLWPSHWARKPTGSRSNASRRLMTRTRKARSCGVRTSTDRPKRSSSCGRSSPSSGLPLPTSTKRAGWRTLRPSRSTRFSPDAATSISKSTRWSSSKLTSSMYKNPRLACASRPGANSFTPCVKAFSRSSAPTTRSSVAPSGRSTTGTGRSRVGSFFPDAARAAWQWVQGLAAAGSQP